MTGHPLRPATRQSLGRPSPHQQADRPRAHPSPEKNLSKPTHAGRPEYPVLATLSSSYPESKGQVTHVLLTRSPLINQASLVFSFDLHVLSTPPAFVLSQDQTLRYKTKSLTTRSQTPTQTVHGGARSTLTQLKPQTVINQKINKIIGITFPNKNNLLETKKAHY